MLKTPELPVAFGKASLKARRGKGVPAGAPFSDWLMDVISLHSAGNLSSSADLILQE